MLAVAWTALWPHVSAAHALGAVGEARVDVLLERDPLLEHARLDHEIPHHVEVGLARREARVDDAVEGHRQRVPQESGRLVVVVAADEIGGSLAVHERSVGAVDITVQSDDFKIAANKTALRTLGITADEVQGTVGRSFVVDTPENQRRLAEALESIGSGKDTSGVLAALGLNTFFTGSTADDLGVNSMLQVDPTYFAASSGGIARDTDNAIALAAFIDKPLDSQNGASLSILYDQMIGNVAQQSSQAKAAADGANTYEATLRGQKESISGVNLDEESIGRSGPDIEHAVANRDPGPLPAIQNNRSPDAMLKAESG